MKLNKEMFNINEPNIETTVLRTRPDILKISDKIADELSTDKKKVSRNTVLNTLIEIGIKQVLEDADKYLHTDVY